LTLRLVFAYLAGANDCIKKDQKINQTGHAGAAAVAGSVFEPPKIGVKKAVSILVGTKIKSPVQNWLPKNKYTVGNSG